MLEFQALFLTYKDALVMPHATSILLNSNYA